MLQLDYLKPEVDNLQKLHGSPNLNAIYGAGCISQPKLLFLFMNPTGRNISSDPKWPGLRAPWLGTKNIWKLFYGLEIVEDDLFNQIQNNSQEIWTEDFCFRVYNQLKDRSIYVTNLAKCTQDDARSLKDTIFKTYLENTLKEIYEINPQAIVSFGNQVSSILLKKNIKVSDYQNLDKETLTIKNKQFDVYPTYYPVGQGMRNINKAISRIKIILKGCL